MSGPIPSSVAFLYSSSMITGDRLLTRNGPSSATASSLILRSASTILSSPVLLRRMLAIATGAPSVSVPVIASRAPWISGALRTESICACVTDSKPSTWSAAPISNEGATTGLLGVRSSPTPGSLTTSSISASICERPPGVIASPRKMSVATRTSPDALKCSATSFVALAMGCPGGRNATSAPSVGGARNVTPAASTTVTTRRTISVMYGRTVTSQLSLSSILLMVTDNPPRGWPQAPSQLARSQAASLYLSLILQPTGNPVNRLDRRLPPSPRAACQSGTGSSCLLSINHSAIILAGIPGMAHGRRST